MAQPLGDPANRIPFIKYVLSTALDQAKQPEPYCTGAILGLHDAVELFVQLIADHVGASVPNKADFLHYWPAVKAGLGAELPQQQAMKRLNQARVGLKHHGIRPSRDDLEELFGTGLHPIEPRNGREEPPVRNPVWNRISVRNHRAERP